MNIDSCAGIFRGFGPYIGDLKGGFFFSPPVPTTAEKIQELFAAEYKEICTIIQTDQETYACFGYMGGFTTSQMITLEKKIKERDNIENSTFFVEDDLKGKALQAAIDGSMQQWQTNFIMKLELL